MLLPNGYQKAIRSLWEGRATVTVREGELDPATGRTEPRETVLLEDEPCRLSYKTVTSTDPEEEAARITQAVTLYLDAALQIPEGSKITVTQNGATRDYVRSGKPAVYSSHQEVPLELWKGWA